MPSFRKPSSLETLSMRRVCQVLDKTCRRLQAGSLVTSVASVIDYTTVTVSPYFTNALTARLRSQVIEETTRMLFGPSMDESNIIAGPAPLYLLVVLLGHDIKKLRVNMCCYYGCSHQTSLLRLLASRSVGLQSLELARSSLLGLEVKLLGPALASMKNLQRLVLRNIASDAVLQVIGTACPRLAVLDIAGSRQVSDVGLNQLMLHAEFRDKAQLVPATARSLQADGDFEESSVKSSKWLCLKNFWTRLKFRTAKPGSKREKESVILYHCENKNPLCDTLRVLNVSSTGVTSTGVLLALMHMPQLESLAEYGHMGRVVEVIRRGHVDFKQTFNLIEARSCRTTQTRLSLLAQVCPKLRKLHISEPHHSPQALVLFPRIDSLSVHSIPTQKEWLDGFYSYLRAYGANLKELDMRATENEPLLDIDLREIFNCCPNLVTFTLDGSNVVWSLGAEPSILKQLSAVQVGKNVPAMAITKILSLAPELKILHAYSCLDMTNEELTRITNEPIKPKLALVSQYGLSSKRMDWTDPRRFLGQNLECFYIYEMNGMTDDTVISLFKHCYELKRIGHLANWGLNDEGTETLRAMITRVNLDVDLCPGSHWFHNSCIR